MGRVVFEMPALPAGFKGDQRFEGQPAQKDADRRTQLDQPSAYVDAGAAEREPGQQGQHRVAGQGEGQAFVHAPPLCHAISGP